MTVGPLGPVLPLTLSWRHKIEMSPLFFEGCISFPLLINNCRKFSDFQWQSFIISTVSAGQKSRPNRARSSAQSFTKLKKAAGQAAPLPGAQGPPQATRLLAKYSSCGCGTEAPVPLLAVSRDGSRLLEASSGVEAASFSTSYPRKQEAPGTQRAAASLSLCLGVFFLVGLERPEKSKVTIKTFLLTKDLAALVCPVFSCLQ